MRSLRSVRLFAAALPTGALLHALPSYTVYVDADGLRNDAYFPIPWQGDASVALFAGGTGGAFEGGAVRIHNNGSTALTIDSLAVTIAPTSLGTLYQFFASSTGFIQPDPGLLSYSLAAGTDAIFAQSFDYNFDTSDMFPIVSADLANNCSVGALAFTVACIQDRPRIDLSIGGVAVTLYDTAHVLDTGGFDYAAFGNESLQWRPIGATGVDDPGGDNAVPEPASGVMAAFALASAWALRRAGVR